MATTVSEPTPTSAATPGPTTTIAPGPDATAAFIADRQRFWGTFTSFVTMGAAGVAVLLLLMWFFLV